VGEILQDLIDAAKGGGVVNLASGHYRLSRALRLDASHANVTICGAGIGATILEQDDPASDGISLEGIPGSAYVPGFMLSNLALKGPGSGSGVGLRLRAAGSNPPAFLSNVQVSGFGSHGILVEDTIGAQFQQIRAVSNGGSGLYLRNSGYIRAFGLYCYGNGIGVRLETSSFLTVGFVSEANLAQGVYLDRAENVTFWGGDIESNGDAVSAVLMSGAAFARNVEFVNVSTGHRGQYVYKAETNATDTLRIIGGRVALASVAGIRLEDGNPRFHGEDTTFEGEAVVATPYSITPNSLANVYIRRANTIQLGNKLVP